LCVGRRKVLSRTVVTVVGRVEEAGYAGIAASTNMVIILRFWLRSCTLTFQLQVPLLVPIFPGAPQPQPCTRRVTWPTPWACPVCTPQDMEMVTLECIDGIAAVQWQWRAGVECNPHSHLSASLPGQSSVECEGGVVSGPTKPAPLPGTVR
jgi:hypothetical protein